MNDDSKRLRFLLAKLLPADLVDKTGRKSNDVTDRLLHARKLFVLGYQEALKASKEDLPTLFNKATGNSRGFALEGAAMAVTMIDELDKSDKGLLALLLSGKQEHERELCAIGVGWASARLRYPAQWIPSCIYELQPVIDGYGFYQGFFNGYKPKESQYFKLVQQEHEAYFNGIGRSIWFTLADSLKKINTTIAKYTDEAKGALWCGVGTACIFTGNDDHLKKLMELAGSYETAISEGAKKSRRLLDSLLLIKTEEA